MRRSGTYTIAEHRDWVDQFNKGVSHLGIPPEKWSISCLAFDIFHGRVNYVKLQMNYVRKMLEGDYEALDKFSSFLMKTLKSWKSFQITPWLNNDGCSKLRGEHTKEFTKYTHEICTTLKTLRNNRHCHAFCDALYAYEKIHCFISFVIIDDYITANAFLGEDGIFTKDTDRESIGERMIAEFEQLTSKLYSAGMLTFLTDRVPGDHETFYAHVVKWYFPQILKRTYNNYGLGLGIYTMEGFESINYMTKRLIRDHTNRRGNICAQTLIKITMLYITNDQSVPVQLELRKKLKTKQLETIKRIHHDSNELQQTILEYI